MRPAFVRVEAVDEGQHRMAFGEVGVDGDRAPRHRQRLLLPAIVPSAADRRRIGAQKVEDTAKLRPCGGEARIELHRLTQQIASLAGLDPVAIPDERLGLDIVGIRAGIGPGLRNPRRQPQIGHQRAAGRALDPLNIAGAGHEALRPEGRSILGIDQRHDRLQSAIGLPDAALHDIVGIELSADASKILGLVLEHQR